MSVFGQLPRAYWFLIAGMFVNRLGAFVLPFLSPYLKEHERLGAAAISAVLACWGLGTIVAGLLGGQLADRWGRKPTLLTSLLAGALVLVGLALSSGVVPLAALAFSLGVVAELYRPAVAAAIVDLVPPSERARAFGHLTWAYNLAFAVSPLLAGLLIDRVGFGWLFVGDGATMLLAAGLIGIAVPETRPRRREGAAPGQAGTPFFDSRFLPLLVAAFLLGTVMIQSLASLAHVMRRDGLDTPAFGRVIAVNGMLIAVLQPWLVPRFERLGRYRVLPFAAILFGGGFALHAIGGSVAGHLTAIAVWTLGEIALFPLCNAAVADVAPEEQRGRYQGAYWMAFAGANVVGPPLGLGALAEFGVEGWGALVGVAGILAAIALAAVGVRMQRSRPGREVEASPPVAQPE